MVLSNVLIVFMGIPLIVFSPVPALVCCVYNLRTALKVGTCNWVLVELSASCTA